MALAVGGCVSNAPAPSQGESIIVDGTTMLVRQAYDWPQMIHPIDPETGETVIVQSGTADTVIVAGAAEDRDLAIAALGQFCGQEIDPMGFDTQVVHRDAASGDWWFDGFRCRG